MEPETESPPVAPVKSWVKHAVWIGLVLTVVGVLSYFMYFFQFPGLRDAPVLNLPIVLLGVALTGVGWWHVVRRGRGVMAKGLASAGLLLTLGFAGLFNFYVFYYSYTLPGASGAPSMRAPAPDFTLKDHEDRPVSLSDYRGKNVILVFYRGHW